MNLILNKEFCYFGDVWLFFILIQQWCQISKFNSMHKWFKKIKNSFKCSFNKNKKDKQYHSLAR
jgi:hypothetical protein